MTDRIEQITQKIYNEGITKAKDDAEQLLAQAKEKADAIIQSAKKTQEDIIRDAQRKAEEEKNRNQAELQLAARQFISQLKQQITTLIITAQIDTPVNEAFNDGDFMKKIILTLLEKWDPKAKENVDLQLILPPDDQKKLTVFLQSQATEAMNKGVEISMDPKLKSGFRIGPRTAVTSLVSPHKILPIILNNTLKKEQKNYCLMLSKQSSTWRSNHKV